MNQEPAISVRNLSKCYKLGTIGRHTLVDECQYLWHKLRGRDPHQHMTRIGHSATEARKMEAERGGNQEFWAIKDISFDVQSGEIIGIIGRNGAGKSTLLKLLTRITEPTSGEVILNGRVASLLEVGTGFHPELTGRENIYMNGTILGMKRREINSKFDEIVEFSELSKFIDTPVKRYSSGMYVRLAFAVAAHLEPEILLVDEVLAVGDAQFQRKCLGKMGSISQQGRTVLFVSHQMGAISQLCKKVMVLSGGSLSGFGPTDPMIEFYLTDGVMNFNNEFVRSEPVDPGHAFILAARTVDSEGRSRVEFDFEEPVTLWLDVVFPQIPEGVVVGVALKDRLERRLFTTQMPYQQLCSQAGTSRLAVSLPAGLLTPGHYSFVLALHISKREILDHVHSACSFSIVDTGSELAEHEGSDYGSFFVNCNWQRVDGDILD